jgi:hypothetical protein
MAKYNVYDIIREDLPYHSGYYLYKITKVTKTYYEANGFCSTRESFIPVIKKSFIITHADVNASISLHKKSLKSILKEL